MFIEGSLKSAATPLPEHSARLHPDCEGTKRSDQWASDDAGPAPAISHPSAPRGSHVSEWDTLGQKMDICIYTHTHIFFFSCWVLKCISNAFIVYLLFHSGLEQNPYYL